MEKKDEAKERNYRYRVRYSQRTIMVWIALTREDKIARLDFSGE